MGHRGVSLAAVVALLVPFLVSAAEFEVVPDTVGIGLQKNFDTVEFESSDAERCVLYHLGNPWAADVTGWLEIEGNLSDFFTRNKPEDVFVPSGTFRYNSSCCLLPIELCFKFPYVLKTEKFEARVVSAYNTGEERTVGGTGSSVGSSVAYTLTVSIHPVKEILLGAGRTKCIDFYGIGEECFSAPWIVLYDTTVESVVGGHMVTLTYKSNLPFIVITLVAVLGLLSYYYRGPLIKRFNKLIKNMRKTK